MSTTESNAQRQGRDDRLGDEELARAVASANVPALLMVVFQFTGDERWLADPYRPTRGRGLSDHDDGGLPVAIQEEIRVAARDAIARLQAGEPPAIASPAPALLTRMLAVCMGEEIGRASCRERVYDDV